MKKNGFIEDENITLLARGVVLKGEIRVDGTVRIDGRLEGDLRTTGTVVVGEDGVVTGSITTGTLINGGKIQATVTASEKVQLLKTGILMGEVHASTFSIEEGARFQGQSDMGISSSVEEPRNLSDLPHNGHELPSYHNGRVALLEAEPVL
jgi:cytoskeletal protein CcmA (bactofilin family)